MKGNNNQLEKNTQPKGEITMKNKMSRVLKNEKGLTLIELLAVIVILAIVAAIAIPAIGNIINTQRDKAVLADMSTVISAAKIANTDGSCGTDGTCDADELKEYVEIALNKTAGDSVAVSNWTITYTLADGKEIKTKKIANKIAGNTTTNSYATGAKITITEANLNSAMGK